MVWVKRWRGWRGWGGSVKILAWVKKMARVAWVKILVWVPWVHKILAWVKKNGVGGVGRNFGTGQNNSLCQNKME